MSKRKKRRFARHLRWLCSLAGQLAGKIRRIWGGGCPCRAIPVEILTADRTRRRVLERELRASLHRLQRALDGPLPAELAVVVQQVIATDRELAGCYQVGQLANGKRLALVRVALQVNGRLLGTDELLAAVAEQCIGLVTQQGTSVLVPIDFQPAQAVEARRPTVLRPDPLAPHPNASVRGERVA